MLVRAILFVLITHHVSSRKDVSVALETESSSGMLPSQFLLFAVYLVAVPL